MKRISVIVIFVIMLFLVSCMPRSEETIEDEGYTDIDSDQNIISNDEDTITDNNVVLNETEEILEEDETAESEISEDAGSNNDETAEGEIKEDADSNDDETTVSEISEDADNNDDVTTDNDTETEEDDIIMKGSARDLNTLGYKLYTSGEYEKALKYFKASIEKDDSYLYPHYNYACTLGVLMKLDYPIWYDSRDTIHYHLQKVIEIKPDYIEKIKNDSDLDMIRKDFEYLQLLGFSTMTDGDIKYILHELDWFINGPGVITPIGGMEFKEDGRFSISFLDLSGFGDGDFELPSEQFEGTYKVQDREIYFTLDEKMLLRRTYEDFSNSGIYEDVIEFKGYLDDDGTLIIEIFDYPIHNWMDEFSA
ncbi:tetratricopeptide repeat protein [Vallitalea okinawensis]|uniref:tetratricopeptide repeat protein n=1 Tax=Vallitalea okinawensis TaxID=2078660 RepID=UPI000CFBBC77|nr:tetratricopeptide repeat protein [Vallitalea okinawensis]